MKFVIYIRNRGYIRLKYIKEDVEAMLTKHKENEGKLFETELKIDEYKKRLEYAGTVYEDTEKEVIENMQLKRTRIR